MACSTAGFTCSGFIFENCGKADGSSKGFDIKNYVSLKGYIEEAVADLSPREKKILEMRFGLTDGVTHTLEEVGKEFGVTRERIRQIEAKAIEKIQTFQIIEKLRDY